jgi:hypothetical protein
VDAGLDDDDPNREKKLGLLKEIYNFNKALHDQLIESGNLPATRRRTKRTRPEGQTSPGDVPHNSGWQEETQAARNAGFEQTGLPPKKPRDEDTDVLPASVAMALQNETESQTDGEGNPDDLPWESAASEPDKKSKEATFKRL